MTAASHDHAHSYDDHAHDRVLAAPAGSVRGPQLLTTPVTPTNVKLAVQLATRHNMLSAAISDMRMMNASHTPLAWDGPAARQSTMFFTPYWVPTEQATAETTAANMTKCAAIRLRR